MGKYLMLWDLNPALVPADPKERATGWSILMQMVKQDMQDGILKDWGSFLAEGSGYGVMEGTEVEVLKRCQRYTPFVAFETHPVASVSQVEQMIASLSS